MFLALAFWASAVQAAGPFAASDWIDYGKPRPVPETKYAGADCKADAACHAKAWKDLLQSRGETELDAASGGRSYRAMIDSYEIGLGLYLVRLDIAADGRATVTSSYPKGKVSAHNLPNDKLEAFLAAVDASQFNTARATPKSGACTGDETVFEALVEDRYKFVVQPCGDEAGLTKAVEILRAG